MLPVITSFYKILHQISILAQLQQSVQHVRYDSRSRASILCKIGDRMNETVVVRQNDINLGLSVFLLDLTQNILSNSDISSESSRKRSRASAILALNKFQFRLIVWHHRQHTLHCVQRRSFSCKYQRRRSIFSNCQSELLFDIIIFDCCQHCFGTARMSTTECNHKTSSSCIVQQHEKKTSKLLLISSKQRQQNLEHFEVSVLIHLLQTRSHSIQST